MPKQSMLTAMGEPDLKSRRPIKARSAGWAGAVARAATRSGLTPNAISVLGIVISALGAWTMICASKQPLWWLAGALAIQLRLVANLIDGMVAVEGGKGGPTGALFNEVPDRFEDSFFLIAAGYATPWPWLGWLAALLAMFTAYARTLGASLGFPADFRGPMAKQHRMAVLTLACLAACAEGVWSKTAYAIPAALGIIAIGAFLTSLRRLSGVAAQLRAAG